MTIAREIGDTSDGPLRAGYRMDQKLCLRGVNFWVHWELKEVDAPRFARWEGKGPARSTAIIEERLEAKDGGTHIDYRNEFKAPLGPLGAAASRVVTGGVPEKEAPPRSRRSRRCSKAASDGPLRSGLRQDAATAERELALAVGQGHVDLRTRVARDRADRGGDVVGRARRCTRGRGHSVAASDALDLVGASVDEDDDRRRRQPRARSALAARPDDDHRGAAGARGEAPQDPRGERLR